MRYSMRRSHVTDLLRFDSRDWRSAWRGLRSHVGAESLIRYLHAFLQGLQESGARGLYHVSRVNTCLQMVHNRLLKEQKIFCSKWRTRPKTEHFTYFLNFTEDMNSIQCKSTVSSNQNAKNKVWVKKTGSFSCGLVCLEKITTWPWF